MKTAATMGSSNGSKNIKSLIKWTGGKAGEIKYIENLIPANYDRYIEPFFGGGAVFFHLKPKAAVINDISADLTDFYSMAKEQNQALCSTLNAYNTLFTGILTGCDKHYPDLLSIYNNGVKHGDYNRSKLDDLVGKVFNGLDKNAVGALVLDITAYKTQVAASVLDKMQRTAKNAANGHFTPEELKQNLATGFTSGTYTYFRSVYNDILLKRTTNVSREYRVANFYFIREYCYCSMFRYNSSGEFNAPYGGLSYNRKNFKAKIDKIFCKETQALFSNTDIYCKDFADFFSSVKLTANDFMFLDPPYDTEFSDYEGKAFTKEDQKRLAEALKTTKAKFILVIKRTDFIYDLYKDFCTISSFNKNYACNVLNRNEREVEHLIITNFSADNKGAK